MQSFLALLLTVFAIYGIIHFVSVIVRFVRRLIWKSKHRKEEKVEEVASPDVIAQASDILAQLLAKQSVQDVDEKK